MLIRIGILDDHNPSQPFFNIDLPNMTLCENRGVQLQLIWIDASESSTDLLDRLERQENSTHVYLARKVKFSSKSIQDFCQMHRIPFVAISVLSQRIVSNVQEYIVTPDILRVLVSYMKHHRIQKAAYIYDNDEAMRRIYELLKLINTDEYFNNFTLDLRATRQEDIYSLLYNIEVHTIHKDHPTKYIFLDLATYADYENMFDKISHMGLTSDLYAYVILSTFDACLWIQKVNFTGRLIYFDYQQRDCQLDYRWNNMNRQASRASLLLPSTSSKSRHHSSYYRSTISFRPDHDPYRLSNSTRSFWNNGSISFSSNYLSFLNQTFDTDLIDNPCYPKLFSSQEYFSYSDFHARLTNSYRLHARSLFDGLNYVLRLFHSNLIDCKTLRFKQTKRKSSVNSYTDVNIYTAKGSVSGSSTKQMLLIGRYSTSTDEYQSCQVDRRQDSSSVDRSSSSRVYYITSLFDEPFLMLRKRTPLHMNYSQNQLDLKQLRGQVLDFHEVEGFCVDLAEKVCSILKITCKFRIVQDGAFGSKNATTGIWNGMVGDVVSRTADMAIAPLTISQKRMEVVDFSKPFMNLGISIMIRKPDAQKPGVFSFMNPVSMEIWLCFSLAYFAVSVVLFLTSRVVNSGWRRRIVRRPSYRSYGYPKSVNDRRKSEIHLQRSSRGSTASEHSSESIALSTPSRPPMRRRHHYRARAPPIPVALNDKIKIKKRREEEMKRNDVHIFGISNALFFSFASFMRQSINLVPKSFSGRVAATSWWYFSLIFVSSYTANLVAFLTVEKLVTPIEGVEDLAKQQEIKYGAVINGTTAAFFEKSNVSVFQHMWAVMQRSSSEVFVSSNDEGVAKVRNSKGKYAFFIESTKNEYVNERLPCDTMKVGSDLDSKGYGIATRLGSDLSEAINIIVTNLRESGFLDKLKQRWWYERSECSQTTKDKRFSELSLSSVTGLFYIFLVGVILSCLIAFAEFLITAKAESEKLRIDFREILRIKMIENLVGITINAQRQLEFARVENACNYHYADEEEPYEEDTRYHFSKPQSDV